MGKQKDLPPSHQGMEKRFLDALERIKEGNVICPDLVKQAKAGKLKLNVTSVALESGHFVNGKWKSLSRSLIGHSKCPYPKVWARIHDEKSADPARTDLRSINADLRKQNRELEHRLKLALTEQAAMANRMQKADKIVEDELDELKRIKARGIRHPHQMPLKSIDNITAIRERDRKP